MSGKLDEISTAIGELRGTMATIVAQQGAIFRKLDEIGAGIAQLPQLARAVAEMKPEVERQKKTRWLHAGYVIGATGGMAGIVSLVKSLFGSEP
jgi:hypothetical protein